ncbi:MAG: methyltransferase domain-containing protein [Acidobacteria bacterium]|nr:methyltransferase domain-containing protein [Acidobacteriota bacterium]
MSNENNVRDSYDLVADEYAKRLYHELQDKAFDRKMLDWLVERVGQSGVICDLGSGPGQIARYLANQGAQVCGIDLSDEMVRHAQRLNPDIAFTQGSMLKLPQVADATFAGVAAFYSIIHIPTPMVISALCEINRILQPGGTLLLTFHIGAQPIFMDEWWGQTVALDFHFFTVEEMKDYLISSGFAILEVMQREPYSEVEAQTKRAYIFARKR